MDRMPSQSRDLTDAKWALLNRLIPAPKRCKDGRGRPWRGRREVLDGILYTLGTGVAVLYAATADDGRSNGSSRGFRTSAALQCAGNIALTTFSACFISHAPLSFYGIYEMPYMEISG
jgi:hypothetical protein